VAPGIDTESSLPSRPHLAAVAKQRNVEVKEVIDKGHRKFLTGLVDDM
jgi:hypothetical protein